MRFLIHGAVHPEALAALTKHEHVSHAMAELADLPEGQGGAGGSAAALLSRLEKRQWNLLTTDTAFIRDLYENKVAFNGVVVQILDELTTAADQVGGIERLFERYKRLTPRRLYTVTRNRVKIRQLPGGHEG